MQISRGILTFWRSLITKPRQSRRPTPPSILRSTSRQHSLANYAHRTQISHASVSLTPKVSCTPPIDHLQAQVTSTERQQRQRIRLKKLNLESMNIQRRREKLWLANLGSSLDQSISHRDLERPARGYTISQRRNASTWPTKYLASMDGRARYRPHRLIS